MTAEKQEHKWARRGEKLQASADKLDKKLESARAKLARQKPHKLLDAVGRLSDKASYKVRAKLHSKISETEHENVGVESSHRSEQYGERAGGAAIRFVRRRYRTRHIRRVDSLKRQHTRAHSKLRFHKMAQEHGFKSNAAQKVRQSKFFQRQLFNIANGAKRLIAAVLRKIGSAVIAVVSNPKVLAAIAVCIILLFVIVQSCAGMVALISNGIGGVIVATTYPPETEEMLAAEDYYAGLEIELQYTLDNYEKLYPDYDEYIYYLDEIKHDPYALISILCVTHDGEWTLSDVQETLDILFERQYVLTITIEMEVRSYEEEVIYIDPDTGESYTEIIQIEYEWFICIVTLQNNDLSLLAGYAPEVAAEQLARYTLYMATLGNRPDLFPVELYPHASTYP